ncbi:stage III sporulation protein AE [Alkalithermobacter thermoalcaliphilus JW-YL-7 = DSM 7308]|uniref:Stage III sporulation protein AE n=1 Tax=Alkalithermobacter thermoalcaliphilus JW-YL-7 = DSM 7308 TaxID=1121328 RepID=A0A150FPU4_CLOPD|nr:stage III sporulation protein AE [[Clostridium] paradoxum JW-YL-7 = DSM 7308]SHK94988.1 stage III sporulation protein AE [[Clostridium] paradoxum JW-YL-7 = DSM 7308]
MKKIVFLTIIIFCVMATESSYCIDQNIKPYEYIEEQLNSMQIWKLEEYLKGEELLNNINIKTFLLDVARGKKNIFDIINKDVLSTYLFREIRTNLKIFISILILSVISSLLKNLDNSFSSGTISKLSNYVIFLVLVSLTFIGYKEVLYICSTTIENMSRFMEIVIPIEIAILVTLGFPITSATLSPIFLGAIAFITMVFKRFIVISMTLAFSILIINSISENLKLKKLFSFIKQFNIFSVGAILTLYLGIISIQGIYITSFDKLSMKTVKFAVGNFIPIVGNLVSDSIDIVLSSSYLLKSVIGSLGLIILLSICLLPIIKIACILLVYKISAAIIEPISDDNIASYINEVGNLIAVSLASLVVISMIFFITMAILASIGNIARI